jgi:hypothetical protein
MKTVGTFDLCMEVTAAACGFNQNQETKTNTDNGLDEKSVKDEEASTESGGVNRKEKDNDDDYEDDEIEKEKYSTTSISPKRQRHISSSENSLTVDDNLLSSNIKKKFRSLSSNSYLGNSRDDYRCKSAELLDSKGNNENFENILTCAASAREFRNKSDENIYDIFRNASEVDSKTSDDEYCKSYKSSSSNIPLSARRRTLKKSKKIIRTDSELFKDQALLKDLDNSPAKKSIVQDSKTNSIEGSEKSSKNMSTDTVFSDTCEEEPIDLERLESEYKEHIRSSLQREYKSDGDSLDEIGKEKYPATEWKNQSIDLNFLEDNNTKYEGYCNRQPRKADSVVECKPARKDSGKRTKSEGDKDTLYTDKNDSIETQSTTEEEIKIESEQSAKKEEKSLSLFERRFGKFRKMNKLLKVKRFSTSALYDNNKKKDSIPQSKTKGDQQQQQQQQATPLSLYSQVNELTSSKASLASPKSLKGKKFLLKKRKFSFFGKSQSNNDINLNLKSIASKLSLISKSNFDLSARNSSNLRLNAMGIYGKYGTSNEYRSDILTLKQHGCTSPLSEAFYNETGSYQLTAMELFEKFCSQDFTGLYKHEPLMESDENTNVDTGHTYKKATSLRKATLLKQNSEPKFNIKSYSSDYYKDQSYYPNPPEAFEEEELECSEGDTYEYPPSNLAERRRSSYTRQHQVEFDQNDQYFEDDERNYYAQEEDQAEEEEGEEEEEPDERLYRIEGDVDEIYFVPGQERYESSFLRNSEEILAIDETDEENFEEEEERKEVVEVIMESREEDYCDQKSKLLSLYEICPKEVQGCGDEEEEDSVLDNSSTEKDSNLKNIISEYVKNACTSASENITRSKSLDLLSNSSETLKTNSNSEYAFDTVKQINLDSCSTSKLSLSLNSDIFDDITLAAVIPDTTIKTLKISEIDDFTITPEGSITESNEGKLVATLSSEISEQEKIKNELQSQYTIIDCDELEHDDEDDEVRRFNDEKSSFAEALNKEFDKLFSRAKNDSDTDLTTTPSVATTVLTAIKLPSRCSMEKLEPFDIDSDDIIGSVSEEKEKTSIKVMSQSMTSTTLNQSISTRSRDEQVDKDKSKRSHSLGAINKRKSNKCTPL